jgi:Domain of unknown function (DUF4410)
LLTVRLEHFLPAFSLLTAAALLTFGCASSAGSVKTLVEPQVAELEGYSQVILTSASQGEASKMTSGDRDRIVALVLKKVQEQMPDRFAPASAAPAAADTFHVTINFTRYDEGNALARAMLAGLGQIHIDADVVGEDRVRQKILMRSKVTKTFAWGGAYGGSMGIRDVEQGFAEAVATLLLARAAKLTATPRRIEGSLAPGSPGVAMTASPAQVEGRAPTTSRQAEGSSPSSAASVPSPNPAPPPPPPVVGPRPVDPSPAPAAPSSPPALARPEVKPPTTHPGSGERYSWILGTWEAVEDKSGVVDGLARFEFWHDGVQLKWRMLRAGWLSGVQTKQLASGTVSKISDSVVELNGKYEITNLVGVGQPVRHSLTREGDRLRGYELTKDGMPLPWLLRRIQ